MRRAAEIFYLKIPSKPLHARIPSNTQKAARNIQGVDTPNTTRPPRASSRLLTKAESSLSTPDLPSLSDCGGSTPLCGGIRLDEWGAEQTGRAAEIFYLKIPSKPLCARILSNTQKAARNIQGVDTPNTTRPPRASSRLLTKAESSLSTPENLLFPCQIRDLR